MILPDSEKVVAGVNRKDEKAWKVFYKSFYHPLCSHCFRIVHEEAVAADIVQDVLIRLWNGDMTFENVKVLTVYMYRAVTNNALKYLRDRNAEDVRLKEWCRREEESSREEFSSAVQEEVLRQLRALIDTLPEQRRKILLMSMEGMSGEEIARTLGVTIHTVKQQKYRAYCFLKEHLQHSWLVLFLYTL